MAHANPQNAEQTRCVGKWMDERHTVFQRRCRILGSRRTPKSNLLGGTRRDRNRSDRPLRINALHLMSINHHESHFRKHHRCAGIISAIFATLISPVVFCENSRQRRHLTQCLRGAIWTSQMIRVPAPAQTARQTSMAFLSNLIGGLNP